MVSSFTSALFILSSSTAVAFLHPRLAPLGLQRRALEMRSSPQIRIESTASQPTHLNLFGNLFGENIQEDQAGNELARFANLASPSFDSLSTFILEWGKLFTEGYEKTGLTTPVDLVKLPENYRVDDEEDVANTSGLQLLFVKTKRGYADKDREEDEDMETKEEAAVKEGGVEVRVQELVGGELQVVASRCEVEEGTMIKEMSEKVIIDSLGKAVAAWKKEQATVRSN